MKPRLTDEEIAKLRELEAEATAGPWSMNRRDWGASIYGNEGAEVASMNDKTAEQCVDDAALIVAMRNALTRLLDERDGLSVPVLSGDSLTVRQAAKMRVPLDGADAQAMEHALTITERELAEEQKLIGEMHEDNRRLTVENAKLRQKVWWVLPTDREKKAP